MRCVLLADANHGLTEGVRSLLATSFEAVVMVADEVLSLFESAGRLQSDLAVVDLALFRGKGLDMVRRLHRSFPAMKIIIISVHDGSSVKFDRCWMPCAHGFIVKRAIATDLLAATDAVMAGQRYVSPGTERPA